MRKGNRQKEEGLVGELFEKDLGKAEALESGGRALEAQRRFEAVAQSFEGLIDTQEIQRKAASLAKSAALKKALKQEKAAHHYELIQLSLMRNAIDRLKNSDTQISVNGLANDVRLTAMLQTARDNSYKGLAAQRVLNSLNSFLSFYLPRDYLATKEFRRAAVVLELATRIDDDRPIVWYNLACAWAQTGKTDQAMEALSRSVDVGYRQLDNFESDTDLDPLRNLPGFPEIADRIRQASEPSVEPPAPSG